MTTAAFVVYRSAMLARAFSPAQRIEERREVACPVMIDAVGVQHFAGEALQVVVFFVGGVIRADDADFAATLTYLIELLRDVSRARTRRRAVAFRRPASSATAAALAMDESKA